MRKFLHREEQPKIDPRAWCAPGSIVIGDVHIGARSSLWFHTVVRGDVHSIRIGEDTNIQDLTMVHVTHDQFGVAIGSRVTIGHSAIIHACTIGDVTLIGMGAIVMDGAEVGDYVLLGAGSLITPGMKIPSGSKAIGRPAKVVGQLTEIERQGLEHSAEHYVALMEQYRATGGSGILRF